MTKYYFKSQIAHKDTPKTGETVDGDHPIFKVCPADECVRRGIATKIGDVESATIDLTKQKDEYEERIAGLSRRNTDLKEEVAELEKQLKTEKETSAAYREANEGLEKMRLDLNVKITDLTAQLAEAKKPAVEPKLQGNNPPKK